MIYLLITWLFSPILWLRIFLKRKRPLKKILVIQIAAIGDFVVTAPLFQVLHQQLGDAKIGVLLHAMNLPLAQGMRSIDHTVVHPPGVFKGIKGKLWLVKLLYKNYDAVFVLSPNLACSLAPFWAGIPLRVSVLPDRRIGISRFATPFLSHGEAHVRGRLFIETAQLALSGLGIFKNKAAFNQTHDIPRIKSGEIKVKAFLGTNKAPFVGLGIGAGNAMKSLDYEQLELLVGQLLKQTKAIIVFVGTEKESEIAQRLIWAFTSSPSQENQYPQRLIDSTGKFSLNELPSLLSTLSVYIGVDSGATYLADAMEIPVIDYMGPADAEDQRPMGKNAIIIRSQTACAPCSHAFDTPFVCRKGTRQCILDFPTSDIVEKTDKLLTECKF